MQQTAKSEHKSAPSQPRSSAVVL